MYIAVMRSRTRFIAGLVALVAMVLSLAETAVASACLPMEAMDATASSPIVNVSPAEAPCDGCAPASDQDHREHRDAPDCPFGPVGGGVGCSGLVSLPTEGTIAVAAPTARFAVVPSSDVGHLLLWVASVFRPPRA